MYIGLYYRASNANIFKFKHLILSYIQKVFAVCATCGRYPNAPSTNLLKNVQLQQTFFIFEQLGKWQYCKHLKALSQYLVI